jgi:hypothetical protein
MCTTTSVITKHPPCYFSASTGCTSLHTCSLPTWPNSIYLPRFVCLPARIAALFCVLCVLQLWLWALLLVLLCVWCSRLPSSKRYAEHFIFYMQRSAQQGLLTPAQVSEQQNHKAA